MRRRFRSGILALTLLSGPALAANLPAGFAETVLTSDLQNPTAMALAPDGRIFVTEQGGDLRVVKNGNLLGAPFVSLDVNDSGERGLLGVALDPAFASNQFVYLYYTAKTPALHNRLSRFTAAGDQAVPGSETVLLDLDNLSGATNHNGGALHFGPDGKLYIAVGENANGSNAQSLSNLLGKILRLNKDGTFPADNPFVGSTSGKNRAIWALGLRNPFTFAFQNGTGRMFINDVGQNTFEEVNDGIAGSNYGWPATEGPTSNPAFRGPIHHYDHGDGCAITGGTFYNPPSAQFPAEFTGDYFFADYCDGWIRRFDPQSGQESDFADGAGSVVDLRVGADGSLWYLVYGAGRLVRVRHTASQAPQISQQPASQTVPAGAVAVFEVEAAGSAPLAYQWRRNGAPISGATAAVYTLDPATLGDHGAGFSVVVSNSFGSVTSATAVLTVQANGPPVPVITAPLAGALYRAGETLAYAGTATDPQDGVLGPAAFTWEIRFHHAAHNHPFLPATSGSRDGSVLLPTVGHTEVDVFYRVRLTVRDSAGATATAAVDVLPRLSELSFLTDPPGLKITLDGQPRQTPLALDSVEGVVRALGAPSPQTLAGQRYVFASWSDGGSRSHQVSTPQADADFVARFVASDPPPGLGLAGTYFDRSDFAGPSRVRLDRGVDFDWSGAPIDGIGGESFSVRWSGQIEAGTSGAHVFATDSTDRVRLYVGEQLVIDHWTPHARTEDEAILDLEAGERYDLRLEFRDDTGRAIVRLLWQPPGAERVPIPSSVLHPYALLVTGQPPAPAIESEVEARLDSLGFVPILKPGLQAKTADADGKALVVIADSQNLGTPARRFRSAPNPIVTWSAAALPVLGLTGNTAGSNFGEMGSDGIARVFPGHPLAGGLAGFLRLAAAPTVFTFGLPNRNAAIVARHATAPKRPLLFGYERGASLPRFGTASGRRVGIFLNRDVGEVADAGLTLLDAALLWAAGAAP